jgi:hypothetical protein
LTTATATSACADIDDEADDDERVHDLGALVVDAEAAPLPIDEVGLVDRGDNTTVAAGADDVIVVDGQYDDRDGFGPHLRLWLMDGTDPTEATPFDLYDAGPVGMVEAWRWPDEFGVLVSPCGDDGRCGSTFDLLAFDPASGRLRGIAGGLTGAAPGDRPRVAAVGRDRVLLAWNGTTAFTAVSRDGEVTPLPPAPTHAAAIVDADGAYTAVSVAAWEGVEARQPLGQFLHVHRFVGGAWRPVRLPPTSFASDHVRIKGSVDGAFLLDAGRELGSMAGLVLLDVAAGEARWRTISLDGIVAAGSPLAVQGHGGVVSVQTQDRGWVRANGDWLEVPADVQLHHPGAWVGDGSWLSLERVGTGGQVRVRIDPLR